MKTRLEPYLIAALLIALSVVCADGAPRHPLKASVVVGPRTSTVTLEWKAAATNASGYIIEWGGKRGTYTNLLNVGEELMGSVDGLRNGATYFFVVKAYDANGNDAPRSAELRYRIPRAVLRSPKHNGEPANKPMKLAAEAVIPAPLPHSLLAWDYDNQLCSVVNFTVWESQDLRTWTQLAVVSTPLGQFTPTTYDLGYNIATAPKQHAFWRVSARLK